jgi:hypothetical protein
MSRRREQILKDDAERLKETQARQRRRRRVTYRRPWGTWPKAEPKEETRPDLRRADALDLSLTLHCADLFLMVQTPEE